MPTTPLKPQVPHKLSTVCLHREPLPHNSSIASQAVLVLEVNSEVPRDLPNCKTRVSLAHPLTRPSVLAPWQPSLPLARASTRHPSLPADPKEYRLTICPVYQPLEMLCSSSTLEMSTRPSNDMSRHQPRFLLLLTIRATHPQSTLDSHLIIFLRLRMPCKLPACRLGFFYNHWLLYKLESPMFQFWILESPDPHVADDAELI